MFFPADSEPSSNPVIVNAGVAGLAELYRTGAATPIQALDLYQTRIAAFDERLGAFIFLRHAAARREAAASAARWAAEKPLSAIDGVPIAVKANIAVAGARWHAGIRAYENRIADADSGCVARLRDRGAIVLGLLNMDEGGLGATGDNPWLGRTHNPYRRDFSPGGSSAGAGAAVSAGLCAAALGTDTLGSVRLPAAFCGCVGYKPTRGTISLDGVIPLSPTLDHVGVLARSVADCAIIATGAGRGDCCAASVSPGAQGLRLAVPSDFASREKADDDSAFGSLIRRAAAAGADIVTVPFDGYDFGRVRRSCLLVVESEAMREHRALETDPAGFSPQFAKMLRWGAGQPAARLETAYAEIAAAAEFIRNRMAAGTALLLPTAPTPPFSFAAGPPSDIADFTTPANVAGVAAITIPIGVSAEGFPLSVQCLGSTNETAISVAVLLAELADATVGPGGWGLDQSPTPSGGTAEGSQRQDKAPQQHL
jgi:aspartyl-tRNA(Asn)/glutamyl-tRNA(Gln) amidotransferase subunit A